MRLLVAFDEVDHGAAGERRERQIDPERAYLTQEAVVIFTGARRELSIFLRLPISLNYPSDRSRRRLALVSIVGGGIQPFGHRKAFDGISGEPRQRVSAPLPIPALAPGMINATCNVA